MPVGEGEKKPPPAEDHLLGVHPKLPGGVQDALRLQDGVVSVAGVEAEEGAEGPIPPLEFLAGLPLQKPVVGEAHGGRKPTHEVQDRPLVLLGKEDELGLDAHVERLFIGGLPFPPHETS